MKSKWIEYWADRMPDHIKEERRKAIRGYYAGSSRQLEQKVRESLCHQIKMICIFTAVFMILLIGMVLYVLTRDQQIVISRNQRGGEEKEETLEIETADGKSSYQLTVRPKGYKEDEIQSAFKRAQKYLEEHIQGKNQSLNEVNKSLALPESIPGENIQIQWQSSDPSVVDEEGNVFSSNVKKPIVLQLNAAAQCQGERQVFTFPICVVPGKTQQKKTQREMVIDHVKKIEEENLSNETFTIPQKIGTGTIQQESKKEQIPVWIFLGFCVGLLIWNREKEICEKRRQRAEEDSQKEYSAIIYRFVLFLETGMGVPAALEEIYREYSQKKEEIFVYEVIGKACRQIRFGMSQEKVFQNMGEQIRLESYRKLTSMLAQSITKGSDELFVRLKEEEEQAFFHRKEYAKRQGEEASTKLLAPMIIMLVVILALLMFPALSAFS